MLNSEQINKTSIKHPAWLLLTQASLKAPNPRVIFKSNMIPRGHTIPIGVSHQISVESSLLPGLGFQDGPHGSVQLFAGIEKLFVTCRPATPTAFPLFQLEIFIYHPWVKADVLFLCSGTERSDSDPVEDTDTSSFSTEIVSLLEHFLHVLSCLWFFFLWCFFNLAQICWF